jgi:hypothetical protein
MEGGAITRPAMAVLVQTGKTVTADAVKDGKRGAVFPVRLNLICATIDVDGSPQANGHPTLTR